MIGLLLLPAKHNNNLNKTYDNIIKIQYYSTIYTFEHLIPFDRNKPEYILTSSS